jgi:hypothetical protein
MSITRKTKTSHSLAAILALAAALAILLLLSAVRLHA